MAAIMADVERFVAFGGLGVLDGTELVTMGVVSCAGNVLLEKSRKLRILELVAGFLTINQNRRNEGKKDYRTFHL